MADQTAMSEYEPYGPEWEKEVFRLTKKELLALLRINSKAIRDLEKEVREQTIYGLNCKLGNVDPSVDEVHLGLFNAQNKIAELESQGRDDVLVGDINQGLGNALSILSVDGHPDGEGLPSSFIVEDIRTGKCLTYAPLESQGQWVSVESAPKDGQEILLFAMGDIGVCYWRDDTVMQGWTWGLEKPFNNPSHWQPLPEPPEDKT